MSRTSQPRINLNRKALQDIRSEAKLHKVSLQSGDDRYFISYYNPVGALRIRSITVDPTIKSLIDSNLNAYLMFDGERSGLTPIDHNVSIEEEESYTPIMFTLITADRGQIKVKDCSIGNYELNHKVDNRYLDHYEPKRKTVYDEDKECRDSIKAALDKANLDKIKELGVYQGMKQAGIETQNALQQLGLSQESARQLQEQIQGLNNKILELEGRLVGSDKYIERLNQESAARKYELKNFMEVKNSDLAQSLLDKSAAEKRARKLEVENTQLKHDIAALQEQISEMSELNNDLNVENIDLKRAEYAMEDAYLNVDPPVQSSDSGTQTEQIEEVGINPMLYQDNEDEMNKLRDESERAKYEQWKNKGSESDSQKARRRKLPTIPTGSSQKTSLQKFLPDSTVIERQ